MKLNTAEDILSVIRQKGKSQNECFKKTKHTKFSEKEHFLPLDTHTFMSVLGGKNCSFLGKFGVLLYTWNTRFEIGPSALLLTIWKQPFIDLPYRRCPLKMFYIIKMKGYNESELSDIFRPKLVIKNIVLGSLGPHFIHMKLKFNLLVLVEFWTLRINFLSEIEERPKKDSRIVIHTRPFFDSANNRLLRTSCFLSVAN